MRYRSELPLVLKNITLHVKTGMKLAIVGRTGSGKSSIIQSLLRLYEPDAGSIYQIYGTDALKLGLETLRR